MRATVGLLLTAACTGDKGDPGQSVAMTSEPPGANCAAGGIKLTSGAAVNYLCNGRNGMGSGKHPDAQPMKGFGGGTVLEVVEDYDGDTYPPSTL